MDDTLIEGGAYIQNIACPDKTIGLVVPEGTLLDHYRETMKAEPSGFVERKFNVAGEVFRNSGDRRLLLRVTDLRRDRQ